MQTNSITYKEDIIKELSQELNIPEEELKEIVDLNLSYIRKSAVEKDVLLISLPNLCKLSFNLTLGLTFMKNSYTKRRESTKRKLEILRKYKNLHPKSNPPVNFKMPLFVRLWRQSKKTKFTKRIYRNMYNMIKDVEEVSNNIINKIK